MSHAAENQRADRVGSTGLVQRHLGAAGYGHRGCVGDVIVESALQGQAYSAGVNRDIARSQRAVDSRDCLRAIDSCSARICIRAGQSQGAGSAPTKRDVAPGGILNDAANRGSAGPVDIDDVIGDVVQCHAHRLSARGLRVLNRQELIAAISDDYVGDAIHGGAIQAKCPGCSDGGTAIANKHRRSAYGSNLYGADFLDPLSCRLCAGVRRVVKIYAYATCAGWVCSKLGNVSSSGNGASRPVSGGQPGGTSRRRPQDVCGKHLTPDEHGRE